MKEKVGGGNEVTAEGQGTEGEKYSEEPAKEHFSPAPVLLVLKRHLLLT